MQVSLLKVVPFSPSFTVFTCPNRVLSGDPALRNPTPGTARLLRPRHYRPHSCRTACISFVWRTHSIPLARASKVGGISSSRNR